jgi:hypothetical protein
MVTLLLPGFDGTGRLFGRLQPRLDPALGARVVSFPPDRALGYKDLLAQMDVPSGPFAVDDGPYRRSSRAAAVSWSASRPRPSLDPARQGRHRRIADEGRDEHQARGAQRRGRTHAPRQRGRESWRPAVGGCHVGQRVSAGRCESSAPAPSRLSRPPAHPSRHPRAGGPRRSPVRSSCPPPASR